MAERARAKAYTVLELLAAAAPFVARALEAHVTARWWADADVQDELERAELLERHTVTPALLAVCQSGRHCECEVGDPCLRLTPVAMALLQLGHSPERDAEVRSDG
jgi:hypothetical protein